MRLVVAAVLLAVAASGCLGSLAPFCEEQGAFGSWRQREVYAALRNETELAGSTVRHQGHHAPTFPFEDAAYQATTQGDGWVSYVSWWSPERRYMMRPAEEAHVAVDGTSGQVVLLEVDRAWTAGYDVGEADRFLRAITVLDAVARRDLAEQWVNGTVEQYGRAKILQASVALDLPRSYADLSDAEGFPSQVSVTQGPGAGEWHFAFDHARTSWTGTPRGLAMNLDLTADGSVGVYYRSVSESPESKKAFQSSVRKDFAEVGLPEPTFTGLVHHGPRKCVFG